MMLNAGTGIIVEDNWFNGGEYCINNAPTTVTGSMKRNKFGPDIMRTGGTGAPFALMISSAGLLTYDGTADKNVWEADGLGITRRGS